MAYLQVGISIISDVEIVLLHFPSGICTELGGRLKDKLT